MTLIDDWHEGTVLELFLRCGGYFHGCETFFFFAVLAGRRATPVLRPPIHQARWCL